MPFTRTTLLSTRGRTPPVAQQRTVGKVPARARAGRVRQGVTLVELVLREEVRPCREAVRVSSGSNGGSSGRQAERARRGPRLPGGQ